MQPPLHPDYWKNTCARGIRGLKDGSTEPLHPWRKNSLLVMSDIHRGASISALSEHEASLKSQMGSFEHVVMNGDNFEMFFIDRAFYGFKYNIYDFPTMPKRQFFSPKFWENFALRTGVDAHTVVEEAIDESVDFLKNFLQNHPQTNLHFVLGNHELIRKFRNKLDNLQKEYPNFEWSAEAIKIGNSLFVHGDLPMTTPFEQFVSKLIHNELTVSEAVTLLKASMSRYISAFIPYTDRYRQSYGITDDERETHRLREAKSEMGWLGVLTVMIDWPGQKVMNWWRSPDKCIPMLYNWLMRFDDTKDPNGMPELEMSENGVHKPFSMKGIKHVFFGHTHVKFDNLAPQEYGDLTFHNTGALTKTVMNQRWFGKPGHGMLQADIRGGKVENIRPFGLENNRGERAVC